MSAFIDQMVADLKSRIAVEVAGAKAKLAALPEDMHHDVYRLRARKIDAEFTLATYDMEMELLAIDRSRANARALGLAPIVVAHDGIASLDNARDWKLP